MTTVSAPTGRRNAISRAVRGRAELLVALFGWLTLTGMLIGSGYGATSPQVLLIHALALAYAVLVVLAPARLQAREPRAPTRRSLKHGALLAWPALVLSLIIMGALNTAAGQPQADRGLVAQIGLALPAVFGMIGIALEPALPVDLFPEARRITLRRVGYLLVSAAFLAMAVQIAGGLIKNLGLAAGHVLGEPIPGDQAIAAHFDRSRPLALLINMLLGAGLIEELWFRVGIMVPVWVITRRWGWGLLASSLVFGLYHISPFSGIGSTNLQWPVTAVVASIGAGVANGIIFRYRGFAAAVLTHGLGDWILLMLMTAG